MFPPATQRNGPLAEELALSVELSRMQGQPIEPIAVIQVLIDAQVKHVLVGAHAISALAGDPRATMDVDLIASRPEDARDALAAAFHDLTIEEHPVVIRFKRDGKEAIDVIRPASSPIFAAALQNTTRVNLGSIEVEIPRVEMALALKFASMISLTRPVKDRYIDAHDFIGLVQHNCTLDQQKLIAFGEIVYAGGGAEIAKMVDDARAGRQLAL